MAPGKAVALIKGDGCVVNGPVAFVTAVTSCKLHRLDQARVT